VRSDLGANCALEAGVEALAGHFRVKPRQPAKASTPLPPNPNAPLLFSICRFCRQPESKGSAFAYLALDVEVSTVSLGDPTRNG
jgi:hypothetical protein